MPTENLFESTLLELEKENQPLYNKYIDVARSGNTTLLTNDELELLTRKGILGNSEMNGRTGVIPAVIETVICDSLGESLSIFLGNSGFIAQAQREFPELVASLIMVMESGEPLTSHPELSALIKYHLVFERFSDGQLDVNIIARICLAPATLKNIMIRRTSEA